MQVRDREVRDHMEKGLPELRRALKEIGFESTVNLEVRRPPEDPILFPASGEFSYTVIDVQA